MIMEYLWGQGSEVQLGGRRVDGKYRINHEMYVGLDLCNSRPVNERAGSVIWRRKLILRPVKVSGMLL